MTMPPLIGCRRLPRQTTHLTEEDLLGEAENREFRFLVDGFQPGPYLEPLSEDEWITVEEEFGSRFDPSVRSKIVSVLAAAQVDVQWAKGGVTPKIISTRLAHFERAVVSMFEAFGYPGEEMLDEEPESPLPPEGLGTPGAIAWIALKNAARSGDVVTRYAMEQIGDPRSMLMAAWALGYTARQCRKRWPVSKGGRRPAASYWAVRQLRHIVEAAGFKFSYEGSPMSGPVKRRPIGTPDRRRIGTL